MINDVLEHQARDVNGAALAYSANQSRTAYPSKDVRGGADIPERISQLDINQPAILAALLYKEK